MQNLELREPRSSHDEATTIETSSHYWFRHAGSYFHSVTKPNLETKPCVSCGRIITWRKKWERNWAEVRYCSDSCRSQKVSAVDSQLSDAILMLLSKRNDNASICPSEAARAVSPDDWESLMEPTRRAARRLTNEGLVVITQAGKIVDPSTAKGPIRIRTA